MGITTVQLECFLEVVKRGNFSLAAAELFLSQPTLSRHIQALEDELRAPLFLRANNKVSLTEIGKDLYPKLEALYCNFRDSSEELHEIVDKRYGRLRLGILASLRLDLQLQSAIDEVKGHFPDSKIQLCHLDIENSYKSLMRGTIDALVGLSPIMPPSDKLRSHLLYEDIMCLAVPANHPNAGMKNISIDEFDDYFPDLEQFILDVGAFVTPLQQELKEAQPHYADDDLHKMTGPFATLDSLMLMIDAGLGAACVNQRSILASNDQVSLIPIRNNGEKYAPDSVKVCLYWVDKNENPLLHDFVKSLQNADYE